jgi:hypothetical protein
MREVFEDISNNETDKMKKRSENYINNNSVRLFEES